MKNIKRITVFLIVAAFIVAGFQCCSKYPDEQVVSFKSSTEKVSNNWKVDKYKLNDVDYTLLLSDYSYQCSFLSGTTTMEFPNKDKEILIIGINNQPNNPVLVILKLEEKACWYYYIDEENKKEFHIIQQ